MTIFKQHCIFTLLRTTCTTCCYQFTLCRHLRWPWRPSDAVMTTVLKLEATNMSYKVFPQCHQPGLKKRVDEASLWAGRPGYSTCHCSGSHSGAVAPLIFIYLLLIQMVTGNDLYCIKTTVDLTGPQPLSLPIFLSFFLSAGLCACIWSLWSQRPLLTPYIPLIATIVVWWCHQRIINKQLFVHFYAFDEVISCLKLIYLFFL